MDSSLLKNDCIWPKEVALSKASVNLSKGGRIGVPVSLGLNLHVLKLMGRQIVHLLLNTHHFFFFFLLIGLW